MTVAITAPVTINRETAAAMSLDPLGTRPAIDGGELRTHGRECWASPDGTVTVGVWEIGAGACQVNFAKWGEVVVIVSGELRCVADADGTETTLRAGDMMVFPRGWAGEWHMSTTLRKIYTSFEAG